MVDKEKWAELISLAKAQGFDTLVICQKSFVKHFIDRLLHGKKAISRTYAVLEDKTTGKREVVEL